jgi:hypothetical protein
MIKHFKFFEGEATKQRVFTDYMEVPGPRLKPFTLNVFAEVLGRIPTYLTAIELSNLDDYEVIRGTTIGQLTSGELNIPWCFTELSITRISDNSHVSIHYHNVDEMDRRALIFDPQDTVTICYKSNYDRGF